MLSLRDCLAMCDLGEDALGRGAAIPDRTPSG